MSFPRQSRFISKRIKELKSLKKLFPTKSEADDKLSSCSNFPEISTETELASNKPVLPEIEHLKGNFSDKELDALRAVLDWNAEVFFRSTRLIQAAAVL